jgi:hypothetical protein
MLQLTCTSLNDLAKLLREKYDVRSKMIVRNFSDSCLLMEEYEIIRINRLIMRHRRRCSHCKLQQDLAATGVKHLRSILREESMPVRHK